MVVDQSGTIIEYNPYHKNSAHLIILVSCKNIVSQVTWIKPQSDEFTDHAGGRFKFTAKFDKIIKIWPMSYYWIVSVLQQLIIVRKPGKSGKTNTL